MLGWLGAGMIIIASGLIGQIMARSYALRPQYLHDLFIALQLLTTEIQYARTSLSEACYSISHQVKAPISPFFAEFAQLLQSQNGIATAEAWNTALKVLQDAGFLKQDYELVAQLGNVLGRSDADDQIKHITILQTRLEQIGEQAEQERTKMVRLWNYLGFCVGALVVLMLV